MCSNRTIFINLLFLFLSFTGILTRVTSQEYPRVLVINQKVGPVIDTIEKKHYGLFPEYPDENFRAAQFIRNPDGAKELHIYKIHGKKEVRPITNEEIKQIKVKIRTKNASQKTNQIQREDNSSKIAQKKDSLGERRKAWKYYEPYTAKAFREEQNHSKYYSLKLKESRGKELSEAEKTWIQLYDSYLQEYCMKLSQDERNNYLNSVNTKQRKSVINQFNQYECHIEIDETYKPPDLYRNSLYMDISLITLILNYERNLFKLKSSYINIKAGYGLMLFDVSSIYILNGVYLLGKYDHHLELDFGCFIYEELDIYRQFSHSINNENYLYPRLSLGYRYQKPDGRFVLKLGGGIEMIYGHISMGYCF